MSANTRVILILILLVGGVGLIAYFSMQDSEPVPSGPSGETEGDVVEAPPVPIGRPGTLTGEVKVFKTGLPAGDIEIRIEGGGKPITRKTNARGIFAASVLSGPPATVTVIAPDPYADIVISGVQVKPDETVSLGTLFLERALVVRGIVVDRAGDPVAGAFVKAFRPTMDDSPAVDFLATFTNMTKPRSPMDETKADGSGKFTLEKLSPGTYRLEAYADGFAVGSIAKAVVSPDSERIVHRLILGPGHKLDGSVTTADGIPVERALVSVLRFGMGGAGGGFDFSPVQTETDDEGKFHFANLTPGQAQLAVRAEGYPMKMQNTVNIGQQMTVDITLGGTSTMMGRVTSAAGEPIEGASLSVAIGMRGGAFGEGVTDADGRYRLEHMPEGRIGFMRITALGYVTYPVMNNPMMFQRGFGDLKAGEVLTKDFTLSSGSRVFGRITGKSDGAPIEGAAVYIMSAMSRFLGAAGQGVTDENGEYEVKSVGTGLYQVVVKAAGYYQTGVDPMFMARAFGAGSGSAKEGAPEVKLAEGGPDQRLDLTLLTGATATGTVVTPDNAPVPGARVTIVPPTARGGMFMPGGAQTNRAPTAITDENGRFVLGGLEAGNAVKFQAEADEWVKGTSEPVALQSGQTTDGVVVLLRAGGSLSGTITGYEGGALVGAEIRAMAQPDNATGNPFQWEWQLRSVEPTLTNQEGHFEITGLTPGKHILRFSAPGHRTVTKMDVVVPEGADGGPVDKKLEKGLQISGIVVDQDGKPIPGANIWTNMGQTGSGLGRGGGGGGFRNTTSKDDGTFLLDSMEPGNYTLTVNNSAYANQTLADIAAGTADLRVVLEKGKTISGRVLLPNGQPAPNVWVSAQGESSANDRTNEKGEFEIQNLPDGAYTLRANSSRVFGLTATTDDEASVMPAVQEGVTAGSRNLELRLRAGAVLEGTVRDEAGQPVAMANVFASEDGSGESSGFGRTDENGRFRVTGLEPGRKFNLSVNHSEFGPLPPRQVDAGATGVDIVLPARPVQPETDTQGPR